MNYQKTITIKANSEAEAQQIADAMSSATDVLHDYLPRIYFGQPFIYLVFQSL